MVFPITPPLLVDEHDKIALFFAKFELENSADCRNDYVQVDNGKKYCGTKMPFPIFNSINNLHITFYSDAQIQA